jgi:hypothetical protein
MTQKNTNWEFLSSVKKGNIGEKIVKEYLEKLGYIIYQPVTSGAHSFDNLAIKNKNTLVVVEVKTKPRRKYYNDTGIELRHYNGYLEISKKHNLKVFIFFVDEYLKIIYGNDLSNLTKPVKDKKQYPLIEKGIIYFHLSNVYKISELTNSQVEDIKKHTKSNYKY